MRQLEHANKVWSNLCVPSLTDIFPYVRVLWIFCPLEHAYCVSVSVPMELYGKRIRNTGNAIRDVQTDKNPQYGGDPYAYRYVATRTVLYRIRVWYNFVYHSRIVIATIRISVAFYS